MGTRSQWLLLTYLGFCAAWMDERPVLESRDGSLFISAARDRNITLKILGNGYVNVNEINLLHVASAAQNATHLIERWRTGYLAEVESNLQRLTQIVEGPEGLQRRLAVLKGLGETNVTSQSWNGQSDTQVNFKLRVLTNRVRRLQNKLTSIETKLKENNCISNPCQNGGTCQDLYEGYQCHCPSNWEGPNCVIDVNECVRLLGTDLGCQNGATCLNLPGSYKCNCASGWHGLHCTTKTSVCNTQNSDELCGHGVCIAKTGSPLGYTCICDQGWQSDGTDPACVKDVNECSGNHRPCSVNPWVDCRNVPGSFFCDSCPRGYVGNGYYCSDIDECLQDNGGCSTSPSVQCINTMGSRTCGPCPTGYRGDGVTCIYVGGCAINNGGCHPYAKCVENPALTSDYVLCRCPASYSGDGIGPNGCQPITDVSAGSACASNPCVHGRCVPGSTAQPYICVCESGYTGHTCSDTINPCLPNPCQNHGTCTVVNGAVTCDCPATATGNRCETLRQTCGGVSRNSMGNLQFPVGGSIVYQHGLSCAWVVITNSSLVLNLTFTRFNLEDSTDCKFDFLQIHDGRNAGSQIIGRFCGNKLPNGNGTIISTHNTLYLWFHSDSSVSHDGFALHWNSIQPVCGGSLTDDYGTISSPGSPGRYPPNRDCFWRINVNPTKRIQFHFGQLMLEEHPTCQSDYLEIVGELEERLGLYCNHTRPPPLIAPGSGATIHFHSDSAGQDSGFQIHYSTIEGIPGCSGVYTAPTGTISLPTHMSTYRENMECDWKIQMPHGERIQITWSKFELEDSTLCEFDYVKIFDGPTSDSPLLGRFCGTTIPPTIRSTSNALLVIFKSDWMLGMGGFTFAYNIICGGVFTESSGSFHSPMYPNSYHHSRICTYEIEQPAGMRIVLSVTDLDIEGFNPSECFFDSLEIFDGDNENSTNLATLCGSGDPPEDPYYSTHNFMFLKFSTDGSVSGRGFMANYTTIPTRCGGLLKTPVGTIQTPVDDEKYSNLDSCIWTIQAPPGYVVQITWLTFDLEYHNQCMNDYVKIYEYHTISEADLLGTFCGTKKPPIITSQGNSMTVQFESDASVTRQGFVASYFFIDASKVCGGHFIRSNGVIRSPNYPESYPNKRECTWVIEAPNKRKVILNVENFELESHSSCAFDYLEIRNGGYDTSPLIGKFCGTDIPSQIISQTNQMYLKFVSDVSKMYKGFSIEWDSTTSGCGGTMIAANGDIISPNYPQQYMSNSDCTWKIHVAVGSLIRLIIVDLDLEFYGNCRFDYIEISEGEQQKNRQKYCGHPYPKVISTNSNIMTIRFRSDYSTSERGFHLKYETLCQRTLTGYYGVIESPNFPNKYERNLNCSWKIDAPRGNRLNLTFSHFDLEKSNDCRYDYVEVKEGEYDVPKTDIAKLCDSSNPPRIHSTQHQVFIKFVTDSQWEGNGFRLEWAVDGCGGHLTRPFGQITSPGYPSGYPIDVDCRWLLEVDYMHSVELTIHDINTEKLRGCFFDKLAIYNGEDSTGLKLVEICYSENPVVFTSTGNKMFLEFHSDVSYAARGFNLTYRSVPIVCGGLFTADTGIIHSTNYPQNYPNNQLCEWLIRVDENYVVNVTFHEFDLEKTANCTDDYVRIYDGPTQDSPLMANLCRNILPPPFVSTANEMLIVMRTDGVLAAKGFKAEYVRACGARLIVKDQGFLTPARSFTGNYDIVDNWNCTWTLIAEDPEDHVTVSFTHLEITASEMEADDCLFSYIEVHEGTSMDGPSRGKWCDSVVPLPVTSTGNALTVHLYVAGYDYHGHFALTYSVLNSACGGTYASYHGVIASPGYPNSYSLNAECVWILDNSPGNQLILTFNEFELQPSENCDLDYLEIREDSGIGKLIDVLCGTDAKTVRSSAKLWIKFKSDAETVAKGFVAEYTFQGGGELSGPTGRITSPLYPIPYKRTDTTTWRITVDFQWAIRIEVNDLFIENSGFSCFNYLRIYDGYNNEAPVLLEVCKFEKGKPVTTIGNVAFIELTTDILRLGSWFDLTWLQVSKGENVLNTEVKLSDCTKEVALTSYSNQSYQFTSPGWPHGYDVNLACTWVFTSAPGTHLVLVILSMDLEETTGCVADALTVYDGNALTSTENAVLLERLCLANSTLVETKASNVMTVKFESDVYINKTGFSAYVYWDCGGKLEGPNGVIEVMNKTFGRKMYTWRLLCEWDIEVKTGRTIEVIVENMSTVDNTKCTDYYMLKNGDKMSSFLLGKGKYCANDTLPTLMTSGNRLYVALTGQTNIHFKMKYREVGLRCVGEYVANNDLEISTPNYPNIPPPFIECKWTLLTPTKELISLNFIDRFDLLYTPDCVTEYVEVRDGGTEYSKLLGRFCGDVAPSTLKSTGNMLYIHYFSDVPEPKNGFKVKVTIGDVCGGIIRGTKGIINSPNYPFYYPTNQTCVWRIIGPIDHSLKLEFRDIHLPGFFHCERLDHVTISEPSMSNETEIEIGTYCGIRKPDIIETSSNEAIITFVSDDRNNYEISRGFSINFTSSVDICGGELTAMSGIIKSNGYPNVATSSRYCDWRIRLPKGYQVVVNILDMDVGVVNMPIRMGLSFYNDFRFRSRIKLLSQNDTMREVRSSSNTMMIGYSLHPGYRGFKLRYTGVAPAPCGGEVKDVNGTLQPPSVRPFNESSYYCVWGIEAPKSMVAYGNDIGLTLSIGVTGFVGGIMSSIHQRICYSYQYILLTDYAMVCGNYTEPTYLTSPKHLNELIVVNSTYGKPMKYDIQYRWQPCGGILKEPLNLIITPKNVSYPVNCAWYVMSPDSGQTMQLSFKKMNMTTNCAQSYINVKNGGPTSPEMAHHCGNVIPNSITSTTNKFYIEYFSASEPQEFEIEVGYTDNVCGGSRSANNRQISSRGFPKSYKNNEECTWEITADNGYHVGLVFIDRFSLESSTDCQNDYVQIFDWRNGTNGVGWQSIGKVCGRTTPPAFNATSNRMKVTFHTNERIQGDGFRAQWYENCGGIFEVTNTAKIIESPGYPNLYRPNLFCNYTLVAPGKDIIVEFMEFQLERGRRDCQFDNLTIIMNANYGREVETYCSDNKPPIVDSYESTEIIFRSDKYIQRTGFAFKYVIKGCGGNITKPGKIKPPMSGDEYFPNLDCVWRIEAPPDKSVVLRFESFVLELVHSCLFDNVEVYDGGEIVADNRLGKLCGNLTANLPVFKSTNNTMVVQFYADRSRHYGGFTAEILFAKSVAAGCGGSINLTTTSTYQFRTQKGSTYDSLEDCHWDVITHPSKNIRFTINSMDLKNNTYINNTKEYRGDYLEVRDGSGPFSELIGKYHGTRSTPLVVTSSGNSLWIRFFSDGMLEGAGVTGTLETIETTCHYAHVISNDTKYELTSPNYPNNYEPSVRCRWQLENNEGGSNKVMVHFKDLDLPVSATCEDSYLEISDRYNVKYTSEGFGSGLVWTGDINADMSMGSYRYCGNSTPDDYYSFSSIVDVTFKADSTGAHRGFKIEYSNANCNRNYTSPQGRIVKEGIKDCWITITAPVNHTISLYFNKFTLYDPDMCTQSSVKVYDGDFKDKLLAMLCGTEIPSPIFSTGNKLSLHSWSAWYSDFQIYDISFTTTDKGRGCGGQLYNYVGSFTSPMYPNEYRNNTVCEWFVQVPHDMKVNLEFTVFDIGTSTNCENKANILKIYEVEQDGEKTLANTFCGGDNLQSFQTNTDRVMVQYISTVNNVGSGWVINFEAKSF